MFKVAGLDGVIAGSNLCRVCGALTDANVPSVEVVWPQRNKIVKTKNNLRVLAPFNSVAKSAHASISEMSLSAWIMMGSFIRSATRDDSDATTRLYTSRGQIGRMV